MPIRDKLFVCLKYLKMIDWLFLLSLCKLQIIFKDHSPNLTKSFQFEILSNISKDKENTTIYSWLNHVCDYVYMALCICPTNYKAVLRPNLNPENFFSPKLRTNSLDCNYNFTSLTLKMGGRSDLFLLDVTLKNLIGTTKLLVFLLIHPNFWSD